MRKGLRLPLLVVALVALASGLTLHAAAGNTNGASRLEASFSEAPLSVTDRAADVGIVQLITRGTGTVEGFGDATVVVGITQDVSIAPCGPGSFTAAATRRIVLDAGVLILHELSTACATESGLVVNGRYKVDGRSSTGLFAGARGTGRLTVDVATFTVTLSGKLKLARSNSGDADDRDDDDDHDD